MKLEEALCAMREGKKIRRSTWKENEFINTEKFFNERRTDACFNDLISDDWEILE